MSGFQTQSSGACDLAVEPWGEAVLATAGLVAVVRVGAPARAAPGLVWWCQQCRDPWWLEAMEGSMFGVGGCTFVWVRSGLRRRLHSWELASGF